MDTDSLYLAVAAKSLEDCVTPGKLEHYFRNRSEWFPSVCCDAHVQDYVACRLVGREWVASEPCCVARARHDKRTPGLFKVEWEDDGFVGMCSKTYYCFGTTDKFSSKGLKKKTEQNSEDVFMEVLINRRSGVGKNHGFRVRDSSIYTYVQERSALTYFYSKRGVQADGVTTLSYLG